MISFLNIERPAIDLHALDHVWNKDVGVCIPIPVRIRRKIVRHEITTYRDVLRNGLAMISRNAGRNTRGIFLPTVIARAVLLARRRSLL